MSTAVSFVNPTAIVRMPGHNHVRFCIQAPRDNYKAGYYSPDDVDGKEKLPTQLRIIGRELKLMNTVEKFHINLGGDKPDRIVVKFHDRVDVNDGLLTVIADFIAERLG